MTDLNPRQADSLEVNEADDGLVVYDPLHDMVHHLNPSAAVIFDLCDGTQGSRGDRPSLAEACDLDSPSADEARAGLAELAERQLIRWDAQARRPEALRRPRRRGSRKSTDHWVTASVQ